MNKIQNIIYISRAVFPNKSANSIHLMKMCDAISNIYSDVTLIGLVSKKNTIKQKDILKYYDIKNNFKLKLFKMPRRAIRLYLFVSIIFWLLFKTRKNTVIYSREPLIILISLILGYKSILESHDFFESKLNRKLERKFFNDKNFLKLVVISQSLKNDYLSYFKRIPKIEVHHDGADIVNLNLSKKPQWTGRANVLQIGYFGHLYKGRGVDLIIDTSKELDNFDFHIFGGLKSDIERYTSQSLNDNIYFHGFKQQNELPFLRSKCDILLMPYQKKLSVFNSDKSTARWMSPMKLFEYMSSKKAIISSDLPVLREVLNDTNSILVKPDDASDWIKAIISLSNKEYREQLANNAYKDFIYKYTWTKRAENIFKDL